MNILNISIIYQILYFLSISLTELMRFLTPSRVNAIYTSLFLPEVFVRFSLYLQHHNSGGSESNWNSLGNLSGHYTTLSLCDDAVLSFWSQLMIQLLIAASDSAYKGKLKGNFTYAAKWPNSQFVAHLTVDMVKLLYCKTQFLNLLNHLWNTDKGSFCSIFHSFIVLIQIHRCVNSWLDYPGETKDSEL